MEVRKKIIKYGQWTVEIKLDDVYWNDSILPELYCKIYAVGTWQGVTGSIWDTWTCAKYDSPELLPDKLKDRINKTAKRMMHNYIKYSK